MIPVQSQKTKRRIKKEKEKEKEKDVPKKNCLLSDLPETCVYRCFWKGTLHLQRYNEYNCAPSDKVS
jgi:hypothetical protein